MKSKYILIRNRKKRKCVVCNKEITKKYCTVTCGSIECKHKRYLITKKKTKVKNITEDRIQRKSISKILGVNLSIRYSWEEDEEDRLQNIELARLEVLCQVKS